MAASNDERCSWETELTDFLAELSAAQDELLDVLNRKLELLAVADAAGLEQLLPTEQSLADRLQACYQRRLEMLDRAKQQGLPGDSLRSLTGVDAGRTAQAIACASRSRLPANRGCCNIRA